MVVFYTNIIDKIIAGGEHRYSQNRLIKLGEWKLNDARSKAEINKEKKL